MSKILITGVNGFIGSHIAEKIINAKHSVRGLIRKTSNLDFIKHMDIELVFGDISDRDSLDAAMKGIDIVVHNAAFASDWGDYDTFFRANVVGTQNVAEIAAINKVKRFVQISTAVFHGFNHKEKMNENTPMENSIFPYCETKKLAELWLFDFAGTTDMEVTAIRPGNVFGTRDHTFIEKYLDALENGKAGYVDGGRHKTCPVYVENLADAIYLACIKPEAKGEAFIISDGLDITWREFTEKFADELGVKRPTLSTPFWLGYAIAATMEGVYKLFRIKNPPMLTRYRISNGGKEYHFSIDKAKNVLGFEPKIGIDEAVRRSVEWYKNRNKK